jgi:REP element-mobilizing transposase RayT
MARQARNYHNSKIYHTIVRGNGSEHIFLNYEDKKKIIEIMHNKSLNKNYDVCAYCILDDHAHFLIKENLLNIAEIMKRVNISYAAYYNKKNSRYGHVFYSRYLSEAIYDEDRFLQVIRYLINHASSNHKNYKKILSVEAKDIYYEYYDYIKQCSYINKQHLTYDFFLDFINKECNDCILDLNNSDDELIDAKTLIKEYFNISDILLNNLQKKEYIEKRTQIVLFLKNNTNLSIRKIADVLNLNRGIVYKIMCDNSDD